MPFNRGDVVLVLFPDSNLRTSKRRPALVVMGDGLQTGLPQTIVAMITSKVNRAGHPSRIGITRNSPEGQQMGILVDSLIMTDNLATIHHDEIDRVVGHLNDMSAVDSSLRRTLGV